MEQPFRGMTYNVLIYELKVMTTIPQDLVLELMEDLSFNSRNPEADVEIAEQIASNQYYTMADLISTLKGYSGSKAVDQRVKEYKEFMLEYRPEFQQYFQGI